MQNLLPFVMYQLIIVTLLNVCTDAATYAQEFSREDAQAKLRQVADFYRTQVGYKGAYLWRYAADLSAQEGEGQATRTSGWTQPPGTPAVGAAWLKAWRLTDDRRYLEAGIEAAHALVQAQLVSGGWSDHFDLEEPGRLRYRYRTSGAAAGERNRSTFDDNKTQSALMLLMHVDEALEFQDAAIHEAVQYALKNILAAQYPNGAWPQQFSEPPNADDYPVLPASFPESWSRTFPKQKYTGYYTLNDNNMSKIIEMLLEASRIYEIEDYRASAMRTGDFFLLAQLPEPQPGWAQQYNQQMHPAWARKFEPPAVTGGESQSVMETLLLLYSVTAERRFIDCLPKALAYYRKSELPDGQLARFYEMHTNRPLYFTKEYELTYSDADMPTHYAFKVSSKLDRLERDFKAALKAEAPVQKRKAAQSQRMKNSSKLQRDAARVAGALDSRGAWVEVGKMRHQPNALPVIDLRTFIKNLEVLARYAGSL